MNVSEKFQNIFELQKNNTELFSKKGKSDNLSNSHLCQITCHR